ncbi:hypothetical protein ACEPPN_010247 [Leptodophora sp. 'Broadleaf-Isolate-01']
MNTLMEPNAHEKEALEITGAAYDLFLLVEVTNADKDANFALMVSGSTQTYGDLDVITQKAGDSQSAKILKLESGMLGLEREKALVEEKLKKTEEQLASATQVPPMPSNNTRNTDANDKPNYALPVVVILSQKKE